MKDSILGDAADHRLADQHRARARSTRPTRSSTSRPPGRSRSPRSPAPLSSARRTTSRSSTAYDYLLKKGLLKEGDKVGHIYFEGEYGANGLAGSKSLAEQKGLKVIEAADQVHRPGHERPGHPVQGRGRQGDRPDRRAGPDRLGGRGRRRRRAWTCRSLGNNPVFAPGLLAGPDGRLAEDAPLRRVAGVVVRQARRPAEGVPGGLPRRDAEPRCARGHRHGHPDEPGARRRVRER